MKLGSILKTVGSSIIKNIVPGGGVIIDFVNDLLPQDKKLPNDATGEQVDHAIKSLSPDQQTRIMEKELDVEIAEINAWERVQGHLAEADKAGASTRPTIALMMAGVVCFAIVSLIVSLGYAIVCDMTDMVQKQIDAWPFVLTIIGVPTELLRYYFGKRYKEKKERYNLAMGRSTGGSLISNIAKMIKS